MPRGLASGRQRAIEQRMALPDVHTIPDGLPLPQRWVAMLAVAVSVGMTVLDGGIANVALPTIAHDLHASPAASIWVVNAYQLAVTVTLLPFASLGDIYGHRRVYCWGLVLFILASQVCAIAPSMPVLVAARIVQGIGGAGIMSVNGALVRFIFPRAQLGRAVGFNGLVVSACSAAGPSVAAAVMSVTSWPWLFFVQVPLGAIALGLSMRFLPRTPLADAPFDPLSALLNALTFGLFITALDGIGRGEALPLVGAQLVVCGVIGVVFVRRQLGLRAPMLPVDLFANPVFALSSAAAVFAHAAQVTTMVSLPFYFQYVFGLSPIDIGLLITPWPTMLVIMAPISGRLADRYNTGMLGGIGLAIMCSGLILVLQMPEHAAHWNVAWRLAVCGLGFGCFQTPNNRLLIGSAPPNRAGAGSGILSTSRLLGQSTGSALVALVFGLTGGDVGLGTHITIGVAAAFAGIAMVLSSLRMGWR
jgi:DHA2 family multidrug resistance protein-like MFS transporter